jgi:hypothetical protein
MGRSHALRGYCTLEYFGEEGKSNEEHSTQTTTAAAMDDVAGAAGDDDDVLDGALQIILNLFQASLSILRPTFSHD